MSNTQPIQFLFYQLATNEQDRERFNLINKSHLNPNKGEANISVFECLDILEQEHIIRTCLSRVNDQAVLGVLRPKIKKEGYNCFFLDEFLYWTFDGELRKSKPLNKAIQALHDNMLELVPEYVEFCKK